MAKFKVGDKVKYIGTKHGAPYGKTLTVVREPDAVGRYIVRWPSDHAGFMAVGSEGFAWEKELVAANAAHNAKFKVGDRVKIVADTGAWRKGEKGTVIGGDYLPGYFFVKFDGGTEGRIPEEKMAAANSRACNAKFKAGDKVYVRWLGSDEEYATVISYDPKGDFYIVRGEDGQLVRPKASLLVAANSCGVRSTNAEARNTALPIGTIGVSDSTILWRMIDGGRDEPYHDEYQKRLDRMNQRDIPEDTVAILKKYGYRFKNAANCGVRSTIPAVNAALNRGDDAIIRLCNPGNLVEASKAGSLHEVRYGAGFVYPLIGKDGVLVRVFRSLSEAHRSPLLNAALGAAANTVSHNARPIGKGEILRRGDYVETPWDGAIGRVVGVKILDRDKGSAVYKVKIEKTGTVLDFPGHHLKVV